MDAVNTLLENLPAAISDMKAASKASDGLVQQAVKFPGRIEGELAKKGYTGLIAIVTKAPRIGRTMMRNLNTMKSIPGRAIRTRQIFLSGRPNPGDPVRATLYRRCVRT